MGFLRTIFGGIVAEGQTITAKAAQAIFNPDSRTGVMSINTSRPMRCFKALRSPAV